MTKFSRRILKRATKKALKISTHAVSGDLTDLAKESISEDLETSSVTETVRRNLKKTSIKFKEK